MRLVLLVSCLLPLAWASSSRACIDDSDCVDLGHKFACFLYKCYNWNEPSPEHPNCRNDDDCLKISRGVKDACYRHWNLRAVNKGVCFSSYSLSPCDKHTDCYGSDSCCGMHCCPEDYFLQWKNFTCFSDQQCKTWMTGDKCCDNNRCCYKEAVSEVQYKEEDVFNAEDYDYSDKVEEEEGAESHVEVTPKVDNVEEIEELEVGSDGSKLHDDDYVGGTTEMDPRNITEEVNEVIEATENNVVENSNEIIMTTEHKDEDDSEDDNEIHVLTEQDSKNDSKSHINITESWGNEQEEDDKSEESEQFNISDYDYYDHDKDEDEDVGKESQQVHGANETSNATDTGQSDNYLNQGQVVATGTEKENDIQENEEIFVERTTNMEEHTVTDIPDDTTEGYKVVIMLNQEEKNEEDEVFEEEIYEDHHDNEEASKENIVILDNKSIWEEEITEIADIKTTESISTENELKPEDTTIVENYEVSSSTMEATTTEEGIEEDSNENFEFIPIETNELESNQDNEISEEVSEGKDTEEIVSLTIKPVQDKTIKSISGSSTFLKPILGQIMGFLYVIKYLLNL